VAALTEPRSINTDSQGQIAMSFAVLNQEKQPPVDFKAIAASTPKGKESKSFRVERRLLSRTEELREHTNLNFSEYVETALEYFNACLADHISKSESQASDAA
jgi:hypothetical protein